jgi:talin
LTALQQQQQQHQHHHHQQQHQQQASLYLHQQQVAPLAVGEVIGTLDTFDDNQKQLLFVDYQTKIAHLVRLIQQTVKDMSICGVNELGQYAQQLTQTYNFLIIECKGAMATCSSKELAMRIKTTIQELGRACIELVNLAGNLQNNANDKILRKELLEQIEIVNKRIQNVLLSFRASAKTTQACINAENSVNGIIADLNTVIMFATAGTLKSESDSDTFSNHREAILHTAKELVEDTRSLVSSCGSTTSTSDSTNGGVAASSLPNTSIDSSSKQDCLAEGVNTSVKTITKLADTVKLGAASLGCDQPDAQVLLINAVKDVASSLSELIVAIKLVSAENKPQDMNNNASEYFESVLTDSAKKMVKNVHSLLKTVKSVEDEAARGTRALESAIEAIYQELRLYTNLLNDMKANSSSRGSHSQSPASKNEETDQASTVSNGTTSDITTKPEDLIRATKQITLATSKAIGAGNSLRQEDAIAAANMGRKAVSDLLYVCRGASKILSSSTNKFIKLNSSNRISMSSSVELENSERQRQVLNAGLNCAVYYKELLECIQLVWFNFIIKKKLFI